MRCTIGDNFKEDVEPEKPQKEVTTRSGRTTKAPVKYTK